MDEGCHCPSCSKKRNTFLFKLNNNQVITESDFIIHTQNKKINNNILILKPKKQKKPMLFE